MDSQESLGHDLPDSAVRVDADGSVQTDVDAAVDVSDVDGRAPVPASASDASHPIATTACTPGTYIGMFQASLRALPSEKGGAWIGLPGTQLAPDAGTWSGKLIMTLMGATGAPDAGEAGAAPIMVTGAQFLGFDTAGDVLSAPLGSLDCSDQTLSAELVDGTIRSLTATSADAGLAAPLTGSLSATNVGASGSLGSVTGQIHLVVAPYFETVGGTWSATRY